MSNVIDFQAFQEARERVGQSKPCHPIQEALDALALALVDHNHHWTDRERELYELATGYLSADATHDDP